VDPLKVSAFLSLGAQHMATSCKFAVFGVKRYKFHAKPGKSAGLAVGLAKAPKDCWRPHGTSVNLRQAPPTVQGPTGHSKHSCMHACDSRQA
jgi:hypothetical protein